MLTDRVAIVTGAGRGIGRAHAMALAANGARVVVNAGVAADGTSPSTAPADDVVAEGWRRVVAIPHDAGTSPARLGGMVSEALPRLSEPVPAMVPEHQAAT